METESSNTVTSGYLQTTIPNESYSVNKKVAVEPFPNDARAPEVKNGLALTSRHRVVALKVIFSSMTNKDGGAYYPAGSTVWLKASESEASWAKEIFEIEGKSVILVPEEKILMVKYDNLEVTRYLYTNYPPFTTYPNRTVPITPTYSPANPYFIPANPYCPPYPDKVYCVDATYGDKTENLNFTLPTTQTKVGSGG